MTAPFEPAALGDVRFNEAGLVPAVAQAYDTGEVLMMAWMNRDTLAETLRTGRACYWSRSRRAFWRKGDTSGHIQQVRECRLDCDGRHGPAAGRADRRRLPHRRPDLLLPAHGTGSLMHCFGKWHSTASAPFVRLRHAPGSSCPDLFRASPSTVSSRIAGCVDGRNESGHDMAGRLYGGAPISGTGH